jgi:hypothetical protein
MSDRIEKRIYFIYLYIAISPQLFIEKSVVKIFFSIGVKKPAVRHNKAFYG